MSESSGDFPFFGDDDSDFASDSDPEFVGNPLSAADEARLAAELERSLPSYDEQLERRAIRTLEVAANILALAEAEPYVPPEELESVANELTQNYTRLTRSRTSTDPQAHADLIYWQNVSQTIGLEDNSGSSESEEDDDDDGVVPFEF